MKNEYLVPVNVVDIVEKLKTQNLSINERMNLVMRLEAIKEYCDKAVRRFNGEIDTAKRYTK